MSDIQKLEFKPMRPGQGAEVRDLVLKAVEAEEKEGIVPSLAARAALGRYVAPTALEERSRVGYAHELVFVDGVLAGMIELKGAEHISMLYVQPGYANKGLGSRLIAWGAARCVELNPKAEFMTVYATDDAVPFYERVGFTRGGSRQVVGDVASTFYRLPLEAKGKTPPAKIHGRAVDMFVFSGTGNSLLIAQTVAEVFRTEGVTARLFRMDHRAPPVLSEETALGLVFPVACFTTYPTVWRFVDSLPAGDGREAFILGTMGGVSGGMQGPLAKTLVKKGYKPIASKFFVMPGNYGNKTMPLERNANRVEKALLAARFFAYDLLGGRATGSSGFPILSQLLYRLGQTRRPWDFFYRMFPIAVDTGKCVRCGRCVAECPAKAFVMEEFPVLDSGKCESCQRCIGFCPTAALHVPGKPAEPYRAMSYEDFCAAFVQ